MIGAARCKGTFESSSAIYAVLQNAFYSNFNPSSFPNACATACMQNVTHTTAYITTYYDSPFSNQNQKYSQNHSLTFSPGSNIPDGCTCKGNLTISNLQDDEGSLNLFSSYGIGSASLPGIGKFATAPQASLFGSLYNPNIVLYEYFGAVNCSIELNYVQWDGSIFNPYPSLTLTGKSTFRSTYSQCYGDLYGLTNATYQAALAASFGIKSYGRNLLTCVQACSTTVTFNSFDSSTHELSLSFGQNSTLPQGCVCGSSSVTFQQWYNSFYYQLPVGYAYTSVSQDWASIGISGNFDYKNGTDGYINCYFGYSNNTYENSGPGASGEGSNIGYDGQRMQNFTANFNVTAASCSGDVSKLNTTVLTLLKSAFPDVTRGFPSRCAVACTRNVTAYSNSLGNVSLVFSPGADASGCTCGAGLTIPLQGVSSSNSGVVATGGVPGMVGVDVQVSSVANQYFVNENFGKVNCTLTLSQIGQSSNNPTTNTKPTTSRKPSTTTSRKAPTPPPQNPSTGIWNPKTSSINAASSHTQSCNAPTCVLKAPTVSLSQGTWTIHGFASLASSSSASFTLCLYNTESATQLPSSCSSVCNRASGFDCSLSTSASFYVSSSATIAMYGKSTTSKYWFGISKRIKALDSMFRLVAIKN